LTLTEEQIWALVAYVQQLPYETLSRPETAKKLENERPVR
jgi:mono/diheme cytochrome c family protein